jgi:hypothetical protein
MKYLLFMLCTLFTCSVYAKPSKKIISINFEINDTSIEGNDFQILYSQTQRFTPEYSDEYIAKCSGKKIHLEIGANLTSIGYLKFNIDGYRSNSVYNQQIIEVSLLVEAGDEVNIRLDEGKVSFFGKNAEKFNCQLKAEGMVESTFKSCPLGTSTYNCIKERLRAIDEMYTQSLNILKSTRSKITESLYNQLDFNYTFKRKYQSLSVFMDTWRMADSLTRSDYTSYFNKYFLLPGKLDTVVNEQMALNSGTYLDYCYEKEKCLIYAPSSRYDFTKENSFNKLFTNILSSYTGSIRDRILERCLHACPGDSLDYYLTNSLKIVKDPISLKEVDKMKRGVKGMPAYNFSLPDVTGKLIKLTDLKGKVVMMDIWFTGCHWCGVLNTNMAPVYKVFKDNPNVVFMSICLDKSKEAFVNSVKSGVYTDSGSSNVYTNGQGEGHDLMKFYGFRGAPHQLLIDKNGKLWKGDNFKISNKDQRAYQEVIDEINAALAVK